MDADGGQGEPLCSPQPSKQQPFPCAPQNLPWDSFAPGEPGLLPVTTANHHVISDSFLTKILKAERERERERGGGNQAHPGNLHLALPNFYVLGLQPWEISFTTKFPAQAAHTSLPGPPRSPSASIGQDPALPPTAPASAASSIAQFVSQLLSPITLLQC